MGPYRQITERSIGSPSSSSTAITGSPSAVTNPPSTPRSAAPPSRRGAARAAPRGPPRSPPSPRRGHERLPGRRGRPGGADGVVGGPQDHPLDSQHRRAICAMIVWTPCHHLGRRCGSRPRAPPAPPRASRARPRSRRTHRCSRGSCSRRRTRPRAGCLPLPTLPPRPRGARSRRGAAPAARAKRDRGRSFDHLADGRGAADHLAGGEHGPGRGGVPGRSSTGSIASAAASLSICPSCMA